MTTIKLIIKAVLYKPLFNALIFLVFLMPGHNVGLAIILLTVIIRLILLPSSMSATRQQKRMRDLQPEIQELQAKYKGDKQRQSQELMAFYKREKINPLGSCLPLLIQLPILLILYYVFINGLNTARFDLLYSFTPRPDFMHTWFLGIDLAKPDRFILPVIAGILQYFQSRQLMPVTPPKKEGQSPDMQSMVSKQMMYLMPVFTVLIAGRLPAALPLYWIVTTLFAIGQQWYVFRQKGGNSKSIRQSADKSTKLLEKGETQVIKKGDVEVTVRKKS